jgi:hypothetical protein
MAFDFGVHGDRRVDATVGLVRQLRVVGAVDLVAAGARRGCTRP